MTDKWPNAYDETINLVEMQKQIYAAIDEAETVKFTRMGDEVPAPHRAHPTDAGVDLTAQAVFAADSRITDWDRTTIAPNERKTIGTGVRVAIPKGYVGLLFARSSLGAKRGLDPANAVGVIDSDYRGEVMVRLRNTSANAATVERGERVVQLVVVPVNRLPWREAEDLTTTERGEGGFGSTGN